ncbi:prolyl oligopeptidase family serine peptidase [Fulvivirgaceae bacterium PWU4]|uniref:Prolyl oligopeptidase family serine peptidase n=1 Tax=Chryseosolibacter histidini TaxID=2782349 RepID=A0AAP2DN61_9BACT|nr:prolyl oligopeptidase family serine peptidase [Chryseosolibacter histidini]MBT1699435.1 prolyl oligopeptidase family serine peptidase [Chryseosolibacter histidini]
MRRLLTHLILILAAAPGFAQDNITYQRPPDDIAKLVEAPLTPAISISHDNAWMLLLERSDYPTIEELSRPELRIAGLRINPDNFGPSRAIYSIGLKAKKLAENKDYEIKNLPSPLLMSNVSFSPDSKKIAFLQNGADKTELWVVDLATLTASKLTERKINNIFGGGFTGSAFSWLSDSQHIVFTAVPEKQPVLPEKPRTPVGPVVEENLGKKAPNRTYQDLLKNPYDEKLFDYYATSELVLKNINGSEKVLKPAAIYSSFSPSPDGKLVLVREVHRPYSYIVPYNRFPQRIQVIDLNGALVKELIDIPLIDNIPNGFNAVQTGPRNHAWRADQPATLYWAEAQDGGDPKAKADIRDKVSELAAPFTGTATELISLPLRYSGITWGNNNIAWVNEFWWTDRKERVYQLDPVTKTKKVIIDRSTEDAYNDPGNVVTAPNQFGRYVMLITKDNQVFFTGDGASPEGDLPFLDRMDLKTGKKTRLWRCEAPYYEHVIDLLDAKKATFITSRESQTENPNYYLRTAGNAKTTQLTSFPHPYPQLKDVKKQVLKYKREDGVDLTADLYLPPGYKKEDGPLPTFLWAYPEEFKSKSNAGQVKGSQYTFTRIGSGSAIFWVTRGYAILDNASIPIVGEGNSEPNDTYVQQLVASAKAAIDHAASMGVTDPNRVAAGGHSYGAFMTANLLAHCDLFKAGIARSGAYNRTLTPFGFQSEERTYWEAPKVYFDMSPFSFADKIKEPLLMIHGEADNNSGTFPIQTERFYNAIKGHGGTARFVLLPYESHGYRAKESILHMLWEMDRWLEKYVKQSPEAKATGSR